MQQAHQQHLGNIFTALFSDMSKDQLYDIMSQMQALIALNEKQAREIFIENPPLTRALFQAQMMLGMVDLPKLKSKNQPCLWEPQTTLTAQPQTIEGSQNHHPVQVGQIEPSPSQALLPDRRQHPVQSAVPARPISVPSFTFQSQAMPSELSAPQTKNFLNVHVPPVPHSSYTQIQNLYLSSPAPPQFSTFPVHVPMTQQILHPGVFNQPLQTPSPLNPRPVAMPSFTHQFHPQMPLGPQPSTASQVPLSWSSFHSGIMPSTSFLQDQSQLPSPPSSHYHYQIGSSHTGVDYGVQFVNPTQTDRVLWALRSPQVTAAGTRQRGSIPMPWTYGQFLEYSASSTSADTQHPWAIKCSCFIKNDTPDIDISSLLVVQLAPEMEKELLQQVMSLTPEQIHLLPPEQRNQVFQLQEMLR